MIGARRWIFGLPIVIFTALAWAQEEEPIISEVDEDALAFLEEQQDPVELEVVVEDPDPSLELLSPADRLARWNRTRQSIEPAIEQLRAMAETGSSVAAMEAVADQIFDLFEDLAEQSFVQAPLQEEAIIQTLDRLQRLIEIAIEETSQDRMMHARTAWEQARRHNVVLDELLLRSDMDRDPSLRPPPFIPPDWDVNRRGLPDFESTLLGYTAPQLILAYRDRLDFLARSGQRRFTQADRLMALEMAELARELAERGDEIRFGARGTFRDHALRLDVLADNLYDLLTENNFLYARRHFRVIHRALGDIELFLDEPLPRSSMP